MSYYAYEQKDLESIIYSFFPFTEEIKGTKTIYHISKEDYTDSILFVQDRHMSMLA